MDVWNQLGNNLRQFFKGLFTYQAKSPELLADKIIMDQKHSQERLSESLTDLIFQRKKFESHLKGLSNKKQQLEDDLKMAALQDRDDLALHLMEELEYLETGRQEIEQNLSLVVDEIATAKQVQRELAHQMKKSEAQKAVLLARSQSIQMRNELESQFSKIRQEFNHLQPGLNGIEENIMKLEAKLENMQGGERNWQVEVQEMRQSRKDQGRIQKLRLYKNKLRGRSLPGQVLVPEIVHSH